MIFKTLGCSYDSENIIEKAIENIDKDHLLLFYYSFKILTHQNQNFNHNNLCAKIKLF